MFLFRRSNSMSTAIAAFELNETSHRSALMHPPTSSDRSFRQSTQQLRMESFLSHHPQSSSPSVSSSASASQPINPPRTSQHQHQQQEKSSSKPVDFGHHEQAVEVLRYTVYDLVALTAEDKFFHQLQDSLRKNGAVTNGLLKQGLPLFLHKNRSVIMSRYFQELDIQQEAAEKHMAGNSDTAFWRGTIRRPQL